MCDKKYTLFKGREGGWPPFLPGRGHDSYSTPFIILLFIEKREGRGWGRVDFVSSPSVGNAVIYSFTDAEIF